MNKITMLPAHTTTPAAPPSSKLLTVKHAAEELGYSDRHIRRLVAEGRLRAAGTGRGMRIIAESLPAFIATEEARRAS